MVLCVFFCCCPLVWVALELPGAVPALRPGASDPCHHGRNLRGDPGPNATFRSRNSRREFRDYENPLVSLSKAGY